MTTQRSLFFDDREVFRRTGLVRTVHHAQKHVGNPILRPEPAWEGAMVPSTVLYDDETALHKSAGLRGRFCAGSARRAALLCSRGAGVAP